jgi:hypothetical protein
VYVSLESAAGITGTGPRRSPAAKVKDRPFTLSSTGFGCSLMIVRRTAAAGNVVVVVGFGLVVVVVGGALVVVTGADEVVVAGAVLDVVEESRGTIVVVEGAVASVVGVSEEPPAVTVVPSSEEHPAATTRARPSRIRTFRMNRSSSPLERTLSPHDRRLRTRVGPGTGPGPTSMVDL